MSPKLRGQDIPRATGPMTQHATAGPGETRVECPREGCDWATVRPDHAVWSALEAHQIRHRKDDR